MRRLALAVLASLLLVDAALPCTGVYVFKNGRALAGNNEDFWNPDTKIRFVPAEEGRHGRVYFGFGNLYPQGGMNTAGLFFDGFATKRLPMTGMDGRAAFEGNLIDEAMATCGSVAEVKALFARYDLTFLEAAMLMFGDRHGDSIIVEGDEILDKDGRFQVVTNFYQSRSPEKEWSCPRHAAATRMLGKSKRFTVERVRDVMKEVAVRGRVSTQYTNVYDLTNGVVHLYHFLDYRHVVTLDLEEELAKGERVVDLPSLFPKKKSFERYRAERQAEIDARKAGRVAKDVDRSRFPDLVGRYDVAFGKARRTLEVTLADGALLLGVAGAGDDQRVELLPEGEDRFFHVDFDGTTGVRFVRDEQGAVTGFDYVNVLGNRYAGARVRG
ncbi:MAG: hypothetical protein ACF8XB_05420 [Planctomycetota bacterium JB042]